MSRAKPVVHLHTHSEYSIRDGISHLDVLCAAAAADGQPALAVTDHGNLGGMWRLQEEAEKAGIKAISGCELYLAVGQGGTGRHTRSTEPRPADDGADPDVSSERKYHHLTVLVESAEGWRNLSALQNAAQDSFWSKPLTDLDLLRHHRKGLIVLTGCLGGPVKSRLMVGDTDGARAAVADLIEVFGREQVYVEVMSHGIAIEDKMTPELVSLSRYFDLPMVATNDSHFVHREGAAVHDAWLCNGTQYTIDSPDRWKFTGEGYWLRSSDEMRALFDTGPGTESAVDTTLEIAERCTGERVLPESHTRLPSFAPGEDADQILYDQVRAGAIRLYGDGQGHLPHNVKERLRYELDIIKEKGFADYFLIVADMIRWAKENGHLVGPGRGSAAGSCVSYCLGIIAVDPLAHGLLFERFLSPTRVGMPDIDTDFEYGARDQVVSYLARRWGNDRVARIGTYGTSQARAALLAAGRVLGDSGLGRKLAEAVPDTTGGSTAGLGQLADPQFSPGAPFRGIIEAANDSVVANQLIDIATGFEGTISNETVHACGVIISDAPLPGAIPLRRDRTSGDADRLVTEWDGSEMEAAGFLKIDVLGVKNLSIVAGAMRMIKESTGEVVNPEEATDSPDDPRAKAAWNMIAEGRTDGIFQLESSGMTDLATRIRPQNIAELAVIIALYRPGPMGKGMHDLYAERKVGHQKKSYDVFTDNPKEEAVIASVLDDTLGIPVYQEQLMSLGEKVAGFDPAGRDRLRHAIGKKVQEEMDEVGEMFLKGTTSSTSMAGHPKQVFSAKTATNLWNAIKSAADYAFNKSHSVGYAKLSYEDAWLKANWPAAYAAAWLAVTTDDEKRLHVLSTLAREGVTVKGPDVNASHAETGLDDGGAVRLGLSEIKGIGTNADGLVAERQANGPFKSLADLVTRSGSSISTIEGLIEAGACDSLVQDQPAIGDDTDESVESPIFPLPTRRKGMLMVAGVLRQYPDTPVVDAEWGVVERSARERARLGVTVSDKPLATLTSQLSQWDAPDGNKKWPVHKLPKPGSTVNVIGILASFTIIKKRTRFARLTIAGTHGSVECVMWSDALIAAEKRPGGLPMIGSVIGVQARVQARREFKPPVDEASGPDDTGQMDAGVVVPTEPKKELSILQIWSGKLKDPTRESWPPVKIPRP